MLDATTTIILSTCTFFGLDIKAGSPNCFEITSTDYLSHKRKQYNTNYMFSKHFLLFLKVTNLKQYLICPQKDDLTYTFFVFKIMS